MRLFAPKLGTGKEQDFFFRRKRSKKTLMNWTSGDPNSRRLAFRYARFGRGT
jgi:hypothetical protein